MLRKLSSAISPPPLELPELFPPLALEFAVLPALVDPEFDPALLSGAVEVPDVPEDELPLGLALVSGEVLDDPELVDPLLPVEVWLPV